jgi:transketolase
MRKAFADAILKIAPQEKTIFITGDLGFMALEDIQVAFGERFINAGVSEQNMIGVAAGLAREGFKVFVYSIAPFCYARPFEQIRNDICFSNLPVFLVGNGGGYAYGYMGPTHHALEDCAVMNAIGVNVIAPAFDADLIKLIVNTPLETPTYLRLGYEHLPVNCVPPTYEPWRKLLEGTEGVLIALGPLSGLAWKALIDIPINLRPSLWSICEFQNNIPDALIEEIKNNRLFIIEEHVKEGGIGMHIVYLLSSKKITYTLQHKYALGYPNGRYGSQAFHRKQSELDESSILNMIASKYI